MKEPPQRDPFLKRFSVQGLVLLFLLLCFLTEYAIIASNPVPREIAFMQHLFKIYTPEPSPSTGVDVAPVDQMLARCPPSTELEALHADLDISFEMDLTGQPLACTAEDGSWNLTVFQKRFYNTLLVMKNIQFAQPLPWTNKPLYGWFIDVIDGIRVRPDVRLSYCCDPGGVINIRTHNLAINDTERWVDPSTGDGAVSLFLLLVHEARHAQGFLHDCGNADKRLTQMGAWGTQYFLDVWLAKYANSAFFAASDVDYREYPLEDAENIVLAYICQKPTPEQPSNR
jgi:hypothetical protein